MNHDLNDWNRLLGNDFDTYEHVELFIERKERELRADRFRKRCQQIGITLLCWTLILGAIWLRFR